jgi:hypothetical protein
MLLQGRSASAVPRRRTILHHLHGCVGETEPCALRSSNIQGGGLARLAHSNAQPGLYDFVFLLRQSS